MRARWSVSCCLAVLLMAPLASAAATHPATTEPAAAVVEESALEQLEQAELGASEIFAQLFAHLSPHAVSHVEIAGYELTIWNINTVQWIAGGLLLVIMLLTARAARRNGTGAPKGAWYGIGESIILFVRDEMVYAVMGKQNGRPLVPFFLTLFCFILFLNLFGLVPDVFHTGVLGTATANLAVTGGLALASLVAIHAMGIAHHGPVKHWKNFIPHVPLALVPLMAVVEFAGIVVKPAALTIRLFANLTAGHLVVLGLFGLAYFTSAAMGGALGNAMGALPLVMAIAIYGLELFVAFVQAYIFTYLTIVFVGASVHPEH